MSQQNQVVVVMEQENPSFIRSKPNELIKVLKELTKVSPQAIEILVKGLSSEDEKIRITCADKILNFQIATAKEVNSDQVTRLIAEIKFNKKSPAGTLTVVSEDDKPSRPRVDFSTVQSIN